MTQGIKQASYYVRRLPILAVAFGMPAFSMTSGLAITPPAPSASQCALIEVHDTVGIGWWSSPLQVDYAFATNAGD